MMERMKEQLLGKNVASEVADQLCKSVGSSLIGQRLERLTRVATVVRTAMQVRHAHGSATRRCNRLHPRGYGQRHRMPVAPRCSPKCSCWHPCVMVPAPDCRTRWSASSRPSAPRTCWQRCAARRRRAAARTSSFSSASTASARAPALPRCAASSSATATACSSPPATRSEAVRWSSCARTVTRCRSTCLHEVRADGLLVVVAATVTHVLCCVGGEQATTRTPP